ncbi:MAG: hypothetical protein E7464_00575 [Ruminococcaceae bacterium]|nr:hypothetical protein [Oscillospiraceae bacterium]
MKCYVCGHEHSAQECPLCAFPAIEIIGGPSSAAQRQLEILAQAHREEYLASVALSVEVYYWKDQDGVLVEKSRQRLEMAQGSELVKGEKWLGQSFARIPEEANLQVGLIVRRNDQETLRRVQLPNLSQPELQQLGVRLDDGLQVRLLLRNSKQQSASEPISLT